VSTGPIQRPLVLADLDFAFGGLAPAFDAVLAGRRLACLALEDAPRFAADGREVPPDPLLKTVLAWRSTVKLSPTPVLPDVGSTVTNTPTGRNGQSQKSEGAIVVDLLDRQVARLRPAQRSRGEAGPREPKAPI
jgi:hypothetical protein